MKKHVASFCALCADYGISLSVESVQEQVNELKALGLADDEVHHCLSLAMDDVNLSADGFSLARYALEADYIDEIPQAPNDVSE